MNLEVHSKDNVIRDCNHGALFSIPGSELRNL